MAEDTAVELETIKENNDTSNDTKITEKPIHYAFKSATPFIASPTSITKKRSWLKRRFSSRKLSLDSYMYEDTVPVHILATKGKLDELKVAIKDHDMLLKETDTNGYTLLHHAALHNQEQVMLYLINCGIDLDAADKEGNTALHQAAEKDFPEACHALLSNGATDSILNKNKLAPLHLAAMGKNKAFRAILDHPVDFNIPGPHSRTPLHIICEYDNIEGMNIFQSVVIPKILNRENGAMKVDATDANGLHPIHLAVRKNSYRVLDFIIQNCTEYGLTVEKVIGLLDEDNNTPLHSAVDSCNPETVEVLLKHGASPIETQGDLIPPLHLACSQGQSDMVRMMVEHAGREILTHVDQQQKTPLHYCTLSIHSTGMIPFFMEKGNGLIVIDAQDARGRTPLHNAVASANLAGAKELISYGADPLKTDNKGLNALHLAVSTNKKVIVNALLELPCADELVCRTCNKGYTGIAHALHIGNGEIIPKMLAALQFEVQRAYDEEGNTYLHLAARTGNIKALKALLNVAEIRKMLNEPNSLGHTPLHTAAAGGHYRCIDLLLNNGAMFHKALSGETAFLIACKNGFTDCAQLLLEAHPSQIHMPDNQGNTPLHAAAQSKVPSMITLILNRKCIIAVNSDMLSFFDIIIDSAALDCALAVINHDRWQECLDFNSPSQSSPMMSLIERLPRAAKAVLDRCHETSENLDTSHPDYWESYDFKYLYCQRTKHGKPHLGFTNPSAVHPEMGEDAIDTKVSPEVPSPSNDQNTKTNEILYGEKTMKVVRKMMSFNRQALLTHPVVNAFLESRWRRYANMYYYTVFLFQVLIVSVLCAFILVVPNPIQPSNAAGNGTDPVIQDLSVGAQVLRGLALFLDLLYSILLVMHLRVHCLVRKAGLSMFAHVYVWINLLSVIFSYIFFLFPNPLHAWPVGAVTCFFAWFSLFLLLERSSIGTLIKMFLAVSKTVFLVLLVSTSLLFAFAFALYILAAPSLSEFDHVGYAFLSVFGFMLGELPYDIYIKQDEAGNLPTGGFVLTFVLLLAILLSIVLANLLIGLAVGDIERVKATAIFQRKTLEIDFLDQLDAGIPPRHLKRFSLPAYKTYPNKKRSIYALWRDTWKWVESQIDSDQADGGGSASNSSWESEMSELKNHILEIKETLQLIQEANPDLQRRFHRLSSRASLSSINFDPGEDL